MFAESSFYLSFGVQGWRSADAGICSLGCRDDVVVRALASHQCGPGSIPRLGVTCGLSSACGIVSIFIESSFLSLPQNLSDPSQQPPKRKISEWRLKRWFQTMQRQAHQTRQGTSGKEKPSLTQTFIKANDSQANLYFT